MNQLFEKNVETAVSKSTTHGKPLVVYIAPLNQDINDTEDIESKNSTQTNDTNKDVAVDLIDNSDDTWINNWFQIDEDWLEKAIWLKLVDNSNEFNYFNQIFHNINVPSVYIIFKGKIELVINQHNKEEEKNNNQDNNDYWDQLIAKLLELSIQSDEENLHSNTESTESTATSTNLNKQPESKHSTFKEKVIETAQQHYKSEVQKEKIAARKERERILELLKSDREERKSKERKLQNSKNEILETIDNDNVIPDIINDNFKDKSKLKTETCSLQIKLTNGNNIRHIFNSHDTLNDVRNWVDENRTDDDIPFVFHRNIPRQTFNDSDELKTLQDLELTPRSLLILKPLQSINRQLNIAEAQDTIDPNIFGKVYNGLSSWWNRSSSQSNSSTSINSNKNAYFPSNNSTNNTNSNNNSKDKISGSGNATPIARKSIDTNNSRSLTPNIVKFVNSNDKLNNDDDDDEKETYNGNAIKLEKSKKDKDKDLDNE